MYQIPSQIPDFFFEETVVVEGDEVPLVFVLHQIWKHGLYGAPSPFHLTEEGYREVLQAALEDYQTWQRLHGLERIQTGSDKPTGR